MNDSDFGKKLQLRRKELGMTLEDVGQAVGVGRSTVLRWEKGMIKNMRRDKIAELAKVLQMSPLEFIRFRTDPNLQLSVKVSSDEDQQRLEALHQNPKLRMLFDIQKTLTDSDLNAVLGVVNAIAKERGDDD